MDRQHYYALMNGPGEKDYELYLNTQQLLACQKDFDQLCNADELQFMIVHQTMELWMKLIAYTLLDVDEYIQARSTNRVLTLMGRVHRALLIMTDTFGMLETMSPSEYQAIRTQLGNGSGQESPGFRTLLTMYEPLWASYKAAYLDADGRTVEDVYHTGYKHDDAYMVAEALVEYDELFHKFRYHHIQLIHRSIGIHAKSLKGRSVELLEHGLRMQFFPELWEIRSKMTDAWGHEYGVVRAPIGHSDNGSH